MTTITTKHWRGTYVAQLSLNDRGTFDREWQEVSKVVKGTGESIRYYEDLHAGWYETREGYRMHKGNPTPKVYYRVDELTVTQIDFEDLASAISGPIPGMDGEWGTATCQCSLDVHSFDVDGFPRCQAHTVVKDLSDSLAVPA
jgi:hypothetical protein